MKTEKVDKRYVIRLTESEATVLEKRFSLSGMNSVSGARIKSRQPKVTGRGKYVIIKIIKKVKGVF